MQASFTATECPSSGDPVEVCDGTKTFWVKMRDTSLVESVWFAVTTVLDRRAPVGNVVIAPNADSIAETSDGPSLVDSGSLYTNNALVDVTIVAREDRSGIADGDAVSGVATAKLYVSDVSPPTVTTPSLTVELAEGAKEISGLVLTTDTSAAADHT